MLAKQRGLFISWLQVRCVTMHRQQQDPTEFCRAAENFAFAVDFPFSWDAR